MKQITYCLLLTLFALGLGAQTVDMVFMGAPLSPANVVPPATVAADGQLMLLINVVRDASGQVNSATLYAQVWHRFGAPANITGINIRRGAAGQNGPLAFAAFVTSASPLAAALSWEYESYSFQLALQNPANVNGLIQDPSQYYLSVETDSAPAGALRGQLKNDETVDVRALMDSSQVVGSTPETTASGGGDLALYLTRDSSGKIDSAIGGMGFSYQSAQPVTPLQIRIHRGKPGANGLPVLVGPLVGSPAAHCGLGTCSVFLAFDMQDAVTSYYVSDVIANPSNYYMDILSTAGGNGVMRGPMRPVEKRSFPVLMSTANVSPAPSVTATMPLRLDVYVTRSEDGSISSAFRAIYMYLPAALRGTALDLHDGAVGTSGAPTVQFGFPFPAPGFEWATYPTITSGPGLATINTLFSAPEKVYLEMDTAADPGGVMRAQFGPPSIPAPAIQSVMPANMDSTATTVAPGELLMISGTNLAKLGGDLSGWLGATVPASLAGATVTIGDKTARLISVSPTQIEVQVPVDTPAGAQPLVVNNGSSAGNAFTITVVNNAPAIFCANKGDWSPVSASNPVRAGDLLIVYATGLGQTSPALASGALAPMTGFPNTVPVTVTIGGQSAPVVYSVAAPGYVGLCQIAVTVPPGAGSGSVPLVIKAGNASSNPLNVAIQ